MWSWEKTRCTVDGQYAMCALGVTVGAVGNNSAYVFHRIEATVTYIWINKLYKHLSYEADTWHK